MFDNSKNDKKKKPKRKINWSEYNESLVKRGEMLFDVGFLHNWRAELKKMNKGKEGANYRYPNSSILLSALHRTCVPTSIPTSRRLSKIDVVTHKETQRSSTRLHNHLVESSKGKDKPKLKSKPRKRQHSDSS
ncbi:MAG TPA: hypothetical protein VIY08_02430 [Candidatus Nitrosocosmicus sp.]